jgi:hypothetical protein
VRRRPLQQLRVAVGVVLDPAEERVERGRELLDRRKRGVDRDERRELLGLLLQRRDEVGLLAREVVVQEGLRDPGLARDRRHRQLGVRVTGEQLGAEVQQPPAALVDGEALVGGDALGHAVRS